VPNAKGRKGMTSRQTHSTDTIAILESSTSRAICHNIFRVIIVISTQNCPFACSLRRTTASLLPCFSTRNYTVDMFQLYCCVDSQSRDLNTTTALDGSRDSWGKINWDRLLLTSPKYVPICLSPERTDASATGYLIPVQCTTTAFMEARD
jgi:hypothetical protein